MSLGEKLSESEREALEIWSEREALEIWYDELDREESIINRDNRQIDLETMREQLEKTTTEVILQPKGRLVAQAE